ncbi:hypothetical protein [Polyangium sp. 6x1]|uniref:hypothetical protein n=1 Tax=Polyangium sp. 6x1 TaxID=3042689 RepID=UPI002482C218|nr:hypothetical protein [Polyangium sp. 6x1]MDI1443619.1 hypothetical protein [Polyangium sp. 6x1]
MNGHRATLLILWLLALLAGCEERPDKPAVNRNDAGRVVVREECHAPTNSCYQGCFERGEELYCPACCFDNLIFCNEGNPYDFERCKTAESNPTPTRPPSKK